jgi:hypothetical protein
MDADRRRNGTIVAIYVGIRGMIVNRKRAAAYELRAFADPAAPSTFCGFRRPAGCGRRAPARSVTASRDHRWGASNMPPAASWMIRLNSPAWSAHGPCTDRPGAYTRPGHPRSYAARSTIRRTGRLDVPSIPVSNAALQPSPLQPSWRIRRGMSARVRSRALVDHHHAAMDYAEAEKAPSTREAYHSDWRDFARWCGQRGPRCLTGGRTARPSRGGHRSR